MSQGAKMGLFGSKDENNESTSDEKKVSTKSKENSPERYAPYSIDSDSETYDTEALSIMDINDIIGVQADNPSDSTLESEFAALSEIITNSKDEVSSEMENSAVAIEGTGKSAEAQQRKNTTNSTKGGMTSISKSLQLIGEAYISDDSQETDMEEGVQDSMKKPSSFCESLGTSKNLEKDEKVIEKCPSEEVAIPTIENPEPEIIITEVKNDIEIEINNTEITEKSSEASKSTEIEKSADFTDSTGPNDTKNLLDYETECMDVDSTPISEILEKLPITLEQPEVSKEDAEKIVKDTEIKSPVVKVENPAIEPAEMEEPMEVDEIVSKTIPEVNSPITAENHAENAPIVMDSIEIEKSTIINKAVDIKPEEIEKSLEKDSDIFLDPFIETKTVEEEPNPTLREKQAPKIVKEKSERNSSKSPENEKVLMGNKLEMEADEPPKKSVIEKVELEICSKVIEESIIEKCQEKSTKVDETIFPADEEKFESEKSPPSSGGVEKIVEEDSLAERGETIEPMEIDDNTQPTESEKNETDVSKSPAEIGESVLEIPIKHQSNDDAIEKSLELTPKSSEIVETVEKESLSVSMSKESLNEKYASIEAEIPAKSLEIGAIVPVESSTDISLKDSSRQDNKHSEDENMEVDGSAKGKKDKSQICEEEGSSQEVEKMPLFVAQEKVNDEKMEKAFSIDTVDDTAILPVSTEIAQIEEICEKINDVPDEILTGRRESVAEKTSVQELPVLMTSDEELSVLTTSGEELPVLMTSAVELPVLTTSDEELSVLITSGEELPVLVTASETGQKNEEKNNESESKEEESPIEAEIAEISTEVSRALKDRQMPDELIEKKKKIQSIISTGDSQSSIEAKEKIDGPEQPEFYAEEISEKVGDENEVTEPEMANEEKESLSFTDNAESSGNIRGIEDVQPEDIIDSTEIEKMEAEPEIMKKEMEVATLKEVAESQTEESHEVEDTKLSREAVNDSKENAEVECDLALNEEKKEAAVENAEFPNEEEKEPSIFINKMESFNEEKQKTLILTGNVELSNEEENETVISTGMIEFPIEEEKEIQISTGIVEFPIEEEKEIQISIKNVESSNEGAKETSILMEKVESSNKAEKQTLISTGNDESTNEKENLSLKSSEKVKSSIDKLHEFESAQYPEDIQKSPENDKNKANEEKEPSTSFRNVIDSQSKTESSIEKEKVIFSKLEVPESTRRNDVETEEEPADEEMNLSLDPEIHKSPLNPSEDNHTSKLSPERMVVELEDDMVHHVEMDLSLDPEEKDYVCPDESSTDKPEETVDECLEKCDQDSSENLKDILSTQSVHVTEIFNDDEQSQSTQEMMESILVTDKGNINKILDDEEAESAEIDEMAKKLPNESDELLSNALEVPMTSQNIDSLEGLLDLDLMPENDDQGLKAVEPIVEKVMKENEDIETLEKVVDVSLLMEGNDRSEDVDQCQGFNAGIVEKIVENDAEEIAPSVDDLVNKSAIEESSEAQLEGTSGLTEDDLEAFDLAGVGADPLESVDPSEETKIDLGEDLLREITVDEERTMELEENLLLARSIREEGKNVLNGELLLKNTVEKKIYIDCEILLINAAEEGKNNFKRKCLLENAIEEEKFELAQELLIENAVEEEKLKLAQELLIENAVEEEKLKLAQNLLIENAVEEEKLKLTRELLLEAAVEEETSKLTQELLLQTDVKEKSPKLTQELLPENFNEKKIILPEDLLLSSSSIQGQNKVILPDEVFLEDPVVSEANLGLSEDISLSIAVRDQILSDVAVEIEDLPPTSEISELESAVKFLQESEEQGIDSPLILSPKLVDSVVDDIARNSDVGIFATDSDICEDASELVAELESITPDPIAISEAEIINEAAKLESERKTKLSEETKLQPPILMKNEPVASIFETTPPIRESLESAEASKHPETPKTHREPREIIPKPVEIVKIEHEPLKKSVQIPKISILEERLKIPPKIEIPQGEVSRICDVPTTPKTSLLIQRDARMSNFPKMLDSPKSGEKSELKIVDTSRKDSEKYDFENVGSPRIILKIAKSAIADCSEPRSPKSPKIRSATNSPNPEDSPGQKLGKIKLKLSKGGHPSIIPNDNFEELCGQWHTEGSSSLSPLGMKIKFSKIADSSPIAQTEKHEDDAREQPKHKFEEAKRTESPIGMKIKLSRTGDPSIVQQDGKESTTKHKEKMEIIQQGSPKRTDSPFGMKIKLSKSGDASIIQPDKQESMEEHRDGISRSKDKLEIPQHHSERSDTPRRTESPLGMKFKLFKTGDASIVQSEASEDSQQESITKRTDSPLGMKIKLSKSRGSASTFSSEISEDAKEKLEIPEVPRRTESPLGMKIKLSKTGDASIIHSEEPRESTKQKLEVTPQETSQAEGSLGVKIKVGKFGDATILQSEVPTEGDPTTHKRADPTIGMKIKLSKSGDASIIHPERDENMEETRGKSDQPPENLRKIDSLIGMKIKFSKTGDASIIQPQVTKKSDEQNADIQETENPRSSEAPMAMKIKLQKSSDGSIVETEKKEKSSRRKEMEMPLEMKIKLSKTGHPTIVACENYGETSQRGKESCSENPTNKHKDLLKENAGMKILKSMHGASLHRSELTIEPIQARKSEIVDESTTKRKEITISPIESKKTKLEAKLSHILPEVTIQPIKPREQKQMMFDPKKGSISRQQMNVISQEISITQVRSSKPIDLSMNDKLKSLLAKKTNPSADCEIIEHRPELIIVNENSNSSQDVMIIEEVPALRGPDLKIPKKRGRPRRNPLPLILAKPMQQGVETMEPILQRDPLALDDVAQMPSHMVGLHFPPKENETRGRPKRTCRSQKSYAPPRRGRGRGGRGKRKMDMEMELAKRPRIDQDLDMIERSTTALITIHEQPSEISHTTSELYKALRQPTMDRKMPNAIARVEVEQAVNDPRNDPDLMTKDHLESLMDARLKSHLDGVIGKSIEKSTNDEILENEEKLILDIKFPSESEIFVNSIPNDAQKSDLSIGDDKIMEKMIDDAKDNKDSSNATDHQNWLTPSSKKQLDGRNEGNMSNVQVMDEETRMSAESGSRSQTPARNLSVQASETIVNEESQGSVLSTATTESEKVKVKIRRMEISIDPDEGPFTVDKVAEYDWPLDPLKKSESFMIQEQISQFLGVKSFKRKYPDLKRRMVDMEERNFLRENGLVSEAMCDMGLTAVSSSEVLDVMCSDFPDQYEEYRKYIREKQMKEHSKKQKELTAAANAEKNRIDLAEMAVQSALSWNVGLNKTRRESRKCSLDLQTFTIHVPKKQQKIEEDDRRNHYPVALIPGQYTDYYREYTPAELRYYPLNTVLYGPMKPNERKFDSQSEGSQSDSDSDSSSDDSSSSSSEGTQDTEASQSTMDDVDVELSRQKEDIKTIKCKMCLKHLNKFSRAEVLIQCGTCNGYVHPSCIDLTLDMVPHIQAYAWQCTDCKTCAQCHDPADEDKMLFCDMCDRGYHIYCVGLRRVPQGRWHCQECAVCASCGSREAGGANSDRNSVAQWQHEYKKGDKNTRVYVSTLCVPCSKLWRKGRYCPHCSRCHTVQRLDLEANLVHCSACDKYLHLGCVETKDLTIDRKNYLCDFCQPFRQHMAKPLVSKVFRT